MEPSVSIVLLNWNSSEHTIECIESLLQIEYENFEITIVDNNSDAHHIDQLEAYFSGDIDVDSEFVDYDKSNKPIEYAIYDIDDYPPDSGEDSFVSLVLNDSNDGFPGGCNIGIRGALQGGSDYVLLLNNDTVVDSDFLIELVDVTERRESVGIAGSKIYSYDNPNQIQSVGGNIRWWSFNIFTPGMNEPDDGSYSEIKNREYVFGTSQLINTDVFRKVGLLDERFFFNIEEYDLCDRALSEGYEIVFVPDSIIWHKGGASAEKLKEHQHTQSLINEKTGYLNYKLIRLVLKKHYGKLLWIIPFILYYVRYFIHKVYQRIFRRDLLDRDNV